MAALGVPTSKASADARHAAPRHSRPLALRLRVGVPSRGFCRGITAAALAYVDGVNHGSARMES